MNLPNKLTLLRVLMIVPFVLFMLTDWCGEASRWIALSIFVIASFTDFLDGWLARKQGLITNFGKFMDPLADKLLVCAAMVCLMDAKKVPAWVVIIVMGREFIISGFRLVASDNGVVIAASYWGKFKTVSQMIMIIMMICDISFLRITTLVVMYIAVLLTLISLFDYVIKNKGVLKERE